MAVRMTIDAEENVVTLSFIPDGCDECDECSGEGIVADYYEHYERECEACNGEGYVCKQ